MRRMIAFMFIPLFASCCGCDRGSMVEDEKHGKKKDTGYYIRMFEAPDRGEWQKPDEVIRALGLKKGQRVADIGAGSGYFTRRFAAAVAPGGEAIGYDVDPGMVTAMKEDAAKRKINNYRALLIRPERPDLGKSAFDMIFICNTYHHMDNRVTYLEYLKPSLNKNGRVVIVDYRKDSKFGPPAAFKLEEGRVTGEFSKAGYRLLKKHDFLPNQYILEFAPH